MRSMAGREDVTLDGRKIKLCCNIGSLEDVDAVLANDGQGIGLFRSEFLYLAAGGCPSEEDQFQAYKRVALAMKGPSGSSCAPWTSGRISRRAVSI